MKVAVIAAAAIAAKHAQTAQTIANDMIKQQNAADQAVGRMLEQRITETAEAGSVDITV